MILKSSHKNSRHLSLLVLILITGLLWLYAAFNNPEKESKYPDAPKFEQKTPLDLIQITVSEKNYKKLKLNRDKAIALGHIESENKQYIPGSITFNGQKYKAEIRLKGDWTDHLEGQKWSFRVKLKGDHTIYGMKRFSIQHPKARGYLNEWLYHKANKKEGLIAPRYEFVEGSIHIKKENSNKYINLPVGIYAIEETFDKLLIESNQRKESIIVKFSEDYFWNEIRKSLEINNNFGLDRWLFTKSGIPYPIRMFSESKYLKDSIYRGYFTLSKYLINKMRQGEIPVSSGFDSEKLAKHNALLNLFGALHGNYIINQRFYYNPITSKLEPIAFDGNSGGKLKKYVPFDFLKYSKKTDSVYLRDLLSALEKVANPSYLKQLVEENKEQLNFYEKVLKKEFSKNLISLKNIEYNQNTFIQKQRDSIKFLFNNIKTIKINNTSLKDISQWELRNSTLKPAGFKFRKQNVYLLKRNSFQKSAFAIISPVKINVYKKYSISIIVKKGEKGKYFGLRMQGKYPNRIDAIFDLQKGKVFGVKHVGSFKNETAQIENIGKGWYKCTLSGYFDTSKIKILLGATDEENLLAWERSINKPLEVYIIPESLTLKELQK